MNFTKNFEIRECGAPVAAGSAIDENSDRIDMANWQSATFIVPITDSVDTGVAALTIEQNISDSDSGMAALSGAVATVTSAANDDLNDKVLAVEVVRPQERYIQAVRTSATANIAYGNVLVILNGPRVKPVPEGATIADMALAIEPDES
jgi:hypothetical protein